MSKQSNHPNQILKQFPITIKEKLNNLLSKQESFNCIKHNYQAALKSANHKLNLTYKKTNKTTKKQRKRKIIYFNPTFSLTIATKFGKKFLNLLKNTLKQTNHTTLFLTETNLKLFAAAWKISKQKFLNKILNNLNLKQ